MTSAIVGIGRPPTVLADVNAWDTSGNFRFSSRQPGTRHPFGDSNAKIFSLAGPRARDRVPCAPTRVPQLLTTAFPSGFVRHPSVRSWIGSIFQAMASAIPPEATAPRSAAPWSQRAASSDGSPQKPANSSGHVGKGLIPGAVHYIVEDQPEEVTALIKHYAAIPSE